MLTNLRGELTTAGTHRFTAIPEKPAPSGPVPVLRLCGARTLGAVHLAIISLFVVVWASPWRELLIAVVVAAPVVQAGWWIFGDVCVLTLLEKRLRRSQLPTKEDTGAPPPNFIVDVASRVLGRPVSHGWINVTARIVMWAAFAIAALRLASGW